MTWQTFKHEEYINLQECLFSGQCFSFVQLDNRNDDLFDSLQRFLLFKRFFSTNIKETKVYYGNIDQKDFYITEINNILYFKTCHTNGQYILDKFFMSNLNYKVMFTAWENISNKKFTYNGLRLLQVDKIECIFSFICSQNNNIKRISKMVLHLKKVSNNFTDLNFCEKDLRANKFGYRAKYILDAAKKINETDLFENLTSCKITNYNLVKTFLLSIKGVGNKVCDCILLMGFGFLDTVPIDVHIYRMTKELFNIESKLTNKNYAKIQEKYKETYGKFCGIAQLYLFKHSLNLKTAKKNR